MSGGRSGGAIGMVALVEAAQALADLGCVDEAVEALGLDPQALVERAPEAADDRLVIGVDRRLGQGGDPVGELDRPLHGRSRRARPR